jgi:hypothetical protein
MALFAAALAMLAGFAGSCPPPAVHAVNVISDGREVNRVKKSIVHNDPLDKDKQSRTSYPSEIVILEK